LKAQRWTARTSKHNNDGNDRDNVDDDDADGDK
jgi:hypothetical protein